ncbi:hypothetical protein SLEP1_g7338 [Rubroshorea leprosula]|uniref:Secoisolariciresinol dehydrogenase n=1 Tax=Rubroshorea leprosula TaxID=152421 RepID=A0AAV5I414_9ROSI|nr:hypothetical protein SLEP1_g7338 [Rubroshorea leprosula]
MAASSLFSAAVRRLEGKVAIITGGASGIGECTARIFTRHGAKVVIADIQDDLAKSVCNDIGPESASFVHCDVTKEGDVKNVVDTTVSKFGKLDIMFNNAGILGGDAKPDILDNDISEFEQVFRVNVAGVFLGTKHAARMMKPARRGSIINTASICSVTGGVASHAYTSSKHGVLGLTRNAAVELGQYGIRVNCVSPYLVPTPLAKNFFKMDDEECLNVYKNLKGANLEPVDVAASALFLASDESKYVSGHSLIIDGGFTITNCGFSIFGQDEMNE